MMKLWDVTALWSGLLHAVTRSTDSSLSHRKERSLIQRLHFHICLHEWANDEGEAEMGGSWKSGP